MTHLRGLTLLLTTFFLVASCSTTGPPSFDPDLYRWPIDEPRVGLADIIAVRGDVDGGFAGRLRGGLDSPLFDRPFAVAWMGDDLLVADPGAAAILRLTADGRILRSPEGLFTSPIGVTTCGEGIAVSDSRTGKVALLNRTLHLDRWLAEGLERPTGVACIGDTVYVVETARHQVLRLAGDAPPTPIASGRGLAPGELNYPAALTAAAGDLWIGDTLNFRIQHLAADGSVAGELGGLGDTAGETPRIKGLAVDRNGNLWVSDAYLDQVAIFDPAGKLLLSLGRRGREPGEMSFPAGIAAHPDGRMAVADSLNRRVQIFQLIAAAESPSAKGGTP